jgi:hypothetical protein
LALLWRGPLCGGLLNDGLQSARVHQTHQQKCLEDGVCELWSLFEELGGLVRIGHDEPFHLSEDIEELGCR